MVDKQKQVKGIIDKAVDDIAAIGMERPAALQLFAFQCIIRLRIEDRDGELVELHKLLLAEIQDHLSMADDETLQ